MVEIEWDGVELATDARRTVLERLRRLASVVDPDGRARFQVEILGDGSGFRVIVAGQDGLLRAVDATFRDRDLMGAVQGAVDLAMLRWRTHTRAA
jgi:hypothetical protein